MTVTAQLHPINNPLQQPQAEIDSVLGQPPSNDSSFTTSFQHKQKQRHLDQTSNSNDLETDSAQPLSHQVNDIENLSLSHESHAGNPHPLPSPSSTHLVANVISNVAEGNQLSYPSHPLGIISPILNLQTPGPSASLTNIISSAHGAALSANGLITQATPSPGLSPKFPNQETQSAVNGLISANSFDLSLDEDAPHEEDDGITENEASFITLSLPDENTHSHESIEYNLQSHRDPSHPPFHSMSHIDSSQAEMPLERTIPPSSRPSSTRKRKRPSESTTAPVRRASSRPKQVPRVKSAEQLATEALIEQQNPHASKNELRSLKLRALHAVRIAERELNMSEAEKQRRLRLREYVRHKRAEERKQKNLMKQTNSSYQSNQLPVEAEGKPASSAPSDLDGQSCSPPGDTSSLQTMKQAMDINNGNNSFNPPNVSQLATSQSASAPLEPNNSQTQPTQFFNPSISCLINKAPPEPTPVDSPTHEQMTPKPVKKGQKTPRPKSTPRSRGSVASLEAEIKRQNPNASQTELKSLKLRALHADRIAEREQNMSEREKTRRQKLREYMRRRRDEVRAEKSQESDEVKPCHEVHVTRDSPLEYRESLDSSLTSESQVHSNENSMSGLMAQPLLPEGMNADDRLAAFSMMELNNNYQHQYSQPHQPEPSPNLHLHPLFQMPMGPSSLNASSPYDCSMHPTYPLSEPWSQIPQSDPHITESDVAQKALHAAIHDAIYMKPNHHHHHHHHQIDMPDQRQPPHHLSATGESLEVDRLANMEQERIRVTEEEILGMERARELAIIAAAAAEVERAQHMPGSTSSHLL